MSEIEIDLQFRQLFKITTFNQLKERYKNWVRIDSGSGADVWGVIDCKQNNVQRVLKIYNAQQLDKKNIIDVVRQTQILIHLQRMIKPQDRYHFINIHEAFAVENLKKNDNCQYSDCLLVLTKYNESLKKIFQQQQLTILKQLSIKDKYRICLQLAKSVQILHDFNIIHRDLKPGNILTMMKDGQLIPVIIDFGHARVFDEKQQILPQMTIMRGSPLYVHPKLWIQTKYGFQWDIYPLGLIFYQLFSSGKFFFNFKEEKNNLLVKAKLQNILTNIQSFLQKTQLPNEIKPIIKQCVTINKKKPKKLLLIIEKLTNIIQNIDKCSITTSDNTKQQQFHEINENIAQNITTSIYKSVGSSSQSNNNYTEQNSSCLPKSLSSISSIKSQNQAKFKSCNQLYYSNSSEQVPKAVSILKNIKQKKSLVTSSRDELKKLVDIENQLKTYQIIVRQKIQKCFKLRLLIICLKYTKMRIYEVQNETTNQFTKKNCHDYSQRINKKLLELLKQFLPHKHLIKDDNYKILTQQISCTNLKIIVDMYKHYAKNTEKSIGNSQKIQNLIG